MSWRTYIGEGKKEWADENSSDYPNLAALADAVKWQLPAKLGTTDPAKTLQFLHILDDEYAMPPSESGRSGLAGSPRLSIPRGKKLRST